MFYTESLCRCWVQYWVSLWWVFFYCLLLWWVQLVLLFYAECCCAYYRYVECCYASYRYAELCKLSGFLQSVIKPRVAPPIIFFSCYVEILIFFSFYLNDSASFSCEDDELVRGVALQLSLHLLWKEWDVAMKSIFVVEDVFLQQWIRTTLYFFCKLV